MLDHTDLRSMLKDPDLLRDRCLIGGEWVGADDGGSFAVKKPRPGR